MMNGGHSALKEAKRITTSLDRAQIRLEASLSHAEATAGALHEDSTTIKVISSSANSGNKFNVYIYLRKY